MDDANFLYFTSKLAENIAGMTRKWRDETANMMVIANKNKKNPWELPQFKSIISGVNKQNIKREADAWLAEREEGKVKVGVAMERVAEARMALARVQAAEAAGDNVGVVRAMTDLETVLQFMPKKFKDVYMSAASPKAARAAAEKAASNVLSRASRRASPRASPSAPPRARSQEHGKSIRNVLSAGGKPSMSIKRLGGKKRKTNKKHKKSKKRTLRSKKIKNKKSKRNKRRR